MEQKNLGSFIWSVVELLRGDFKQSEYGLVDPGIGSVTQRFNGAELTQNDE